jgi:hypothetical protein
MGMTERKSVVKMKTTSRQERIVRYVERMRHLLDQRNYCNVQIRDLHGEIRKELGIPRDDFIAAMRLQSLASGNREKTVANIGEVLRALGTAVPAIEGAVADSDAG